MASESTNTDISKGMAFFARAEEVAATDNFDYAIDMYIEGLRRAPDALEEGHKPLRHNALIRQGKGGKRPSMMEKMKRMRGKDPLESMLNAEYLLAKDPDNLSFAEAMLKPAVQGGYRQTALWIADLIFEANRAIDKPSAQTFKLLKESYTELEEYSKAVAACQHAVRLNPSDGALADELRDLSANLAVKKGKYGEEGDFRNSIKDRKSQERLQSQQNLIKSEDDQTATIAEARLALEKDPDSTENIIKLAEALADTHITKDSSEAVELLNSAYTTGNDFSFKRKAGEIAIKHLKRRWQKVKTALEAQPSDAKLKEKLGNVSKAILATELEHYRLCVENYPTDLRMKYDYGTRLMRAGKYDEAIPIFQDARREPRHKISAMDKIGLCFFMKGWFSDAADMFKKAIEAHELEDDAIAKDLRYNLARVLEQQDQKAEALAIYRKLAQLDFGYKDVHKRVDRLREK